MGGFGRRAREARRRAHAAHAAAEAARPAPRFDDVLAWRAVVIETPHARAGCDRRLERGARAHLGVGVGAAAPRLPCPACLEARRSEP